MKSIIFEGRWVYLLSTVLNTKKYRSCLALKNLLLYGGENTHRKLVNFIIKKKYRLVRSVESSAWLNGPMSGIDNMCSKKRGGKRWHGAGATNWEYFVWEEVRTGPHSPFLHPHTLVIRVAGNLILAPAVPTGGIWWCGWEIYGTEKAQE